MIEQNRPYAEYKFTCDEKNCKAIIEISDFYWDAISKANKEGWQIKGQRGDFCPKHKKAVNE